jgi:hypothetical protein
MWNSLLARLYLVQISSVLLGYVVRSDRLHIFKHYHQTKP